jgi:hypothetical protein
MVRSMGQAGMPEMAAPNGPETAEPRCRIVVRIKFVKPVTGRHVESNAGAVW